MGFSLSLKRCALACAGPAGSSLLGEPAAHGQYGCFVCTRWAWTCPRTACGLFSVGSRGEEKLEGRLVALGESENRAQSTCVLTFASKGAFGDEEKKF
jgi:hypothetical protein